MPIQLPPISRRRFLAGSVAAGVSLVFDHKLYAAQPADPYSWALLADTHIAADRNQIGRGVNMADNLKKVAQELIALPAQPAGVLVDGDCAYNTGEAGDYATLTELLQPIRQAGVPIHLA